MTKHRTCISFIASAALAATVGLAVTACGSHVGTADRSPHRVRGHGGFTIAALFSSQVDAIEDGDTFFLLTRYQGSKTVRVVGIDTPEKPQKPWSIVATNNLKTLLPTGSTVTLDTEVEEFDSSGRILAHVTNQNGVLVNQDQLAKGLAVLFAIWPNTMGKFLPYRDAQIAARQANLGMWPDVNSGAMKLPYVWRAKQGMTMFCGDFFTKQYVPPADYARVHVNNRVFFFTEAETASAGFTACPKLTGDYDPTCFSPSGE